MFNTEPYEGNEETDHYLSSRGIRQHRKRKYMSLEKFVYECSMPHESLIETLIGLQNEIDKNKIKVDWEKILT